MSEQKMVPVKYIGKKPFAVDNVAGSGAVWNGPGDVQLVEDVKARKLASYRDQWELAEGVASGAPVGDLSSLLKELAQTDPVVTDPVVTDPVVTDPVVTDPVVTDPVVTDPVVPPATPSKPSQGKKKAAAADDFKD